MELPLSISNLQEQWLLSFLKKLDPANITELFWQLRPYVVLHHVEFKESSFSFSSVGIINFVDIVGFVRKNDTLGILLRNGCFYLFSAVSMDRQCILVCDPEFYKQTGRRLGGWSLFCRETAIIVVENKGISASEYILMLYFFLPLSID
ncbi:MAG: hypothetical protein ACLR80_08245 [Parabacteroides merdae]